MMLMITIGIFDSIIFIAPLRVMIASAEAVGYPRGWIVLLSLAD